MSPRLRRNTDYVNVPVDSGGQSGSGFDLTPGQQKALLYGGTAVGVPGYLYTRGLRGMGVPLSKVPQVLKRDIAALGTHEVAPGKFKYATFGGITDTMRQGLVGTGTGLKEGAGKFWRQVKGGFRGMSSTPVKKLSARHGRLIDLNSKLESLVQLDNKTDYAIGGGLLGGAAITGLYNRGKSIPVSRQELRTLSPFQRSIKSRGVLGNIATGGKSVFNQAAIGANMARIPDVRAALTHDARSRMATSLARVARKIRP